MKGVKRYLTSLIEKEIKTRNESKSLYIQWHITSKCSENCKHCYLDKNKVQSFSLDDSIKIIEMIEELSFSYDNNCTIGITGGDPLVNNSIYDIIKMCHDKGFQVNIKGNPNLITDEIAKLLVKSGITSYQLSIDGTRSTHDNIRSSGSFDRTIKAINIMTEYGIKVGVKYTVSKTNMNDFFEVMDIAHDNKVYYIDFARYIPIMKEDWSIVPSPYDYRNFLISVLDKFQNMLKRGTKLRLNFRDYLWYALFDELNLIPNEFKDSEKFIAGCSMGLTNHPLLVINYDGEVLPCAKMKKFSLGNVYKDSLISIVNNTSSRYLKQLDSYIKCRNCNLVSLCRGCPATGYNNNCVLHDLCCWRADVKSNKENLMKLC